MKKQMADLNEDVMIAEEFWQMEGEVQLEASSAQQAGIKEVSKQEHAMLKDERAKSEKDKMIHEDEEATKLR